MQSLQQSYAGLDLLVRLNADRFLFVGAISAAILSGIWIASIPCSTGVNPGFHRTQNVLRATLKQRHRARCSSCF